MANRTLEGHTHSRLILDGNISTSNRLKGHRLLRPPYQKAAVTSSAMHSFAAPLSENSQQASAPVDSQVPGPLLAPPLVLSKTSG